MEVFWTFTELWLIDALRSANEVVKGNGLDTLMKYKTSRMPSCDESLFDTVRGSCSGQDELGQVSAH